MTFMRYDHLLAKLHVWTFDPCQLAIAISFLAIFVFGPTGKAQPLCISAGRVTSNEEVQARSLSVFFFFFFLARKVMFYRRQR